PGGLHGGRDRRAGPAGGAHPGVAPGRVPARQPPLRGQPPPEPGPLSDACRDGTEPPASLSTGRRGPCGPAGAKTTPARPAIPPRYHPLLDWYAREYAP